MEVFKKAIDSPQVQGLISRKWSVNELFSV